MSRRRRNREYWSERFEYLQNQLLKKGDDYYKDLANAYEKALVSIEKDISYFYFQFAQDNRVSYAEAKQALNSRERRRFQMSLDDYIERGRTLNYSKKWDKRLNNASTAHRISRLESLQIQMGQQIEELHIRFNTEMSDLAREIIAEGQLKSTYELQIGMEEGRAFELLDTRTVESIVAKPWTKDDRTFSDRIWRNKDKLVDTLENKLEVAFIRGDPPGKLIKEVMQEFNTSKFNASRLVQTESAYLSSVTTLKSYEDMEIEKFIIIATLDEVTSEVCQDLDGKVFKVSDYRIGDTAPPFHPFCRTTTAPYDEDISGGGERAARGADGKVYYVHGDITYHEWVNGFTAEQAGAFELAQKKHRNRASDREQFERYREVIKPEMPVSLAEFQEIKYNNINRYEELKGLYRDVNWQVDAQRNIVSQEVHSVPFQAEPNSVFDKTDRGKIASRRYYGQTGKPRLDIDFTQHNNPKDHPVAPHMHGWNHDTGNPVRVKIGVKLTKAEEIANKEILKGVEFHGYS